MPQEIERAPLRTRPPLSAGRSLKVVGGIVAFGLLFGLAVVLLDRNRSALPNVGVTVADIAQRPEAYLGKTVVVSAEVNEILGPQLLTMGGEGFAAGPTLLVVGARPFPDITTRTVAPLMDEDLIQVTGTVRQFDLRGFEAELGVDLPDGPLAAWNGRPAVLARQIELPPPLPAQR